MGSSGSFGGVWGKVFERFSDVVREVVGRKNFERTFVQVENVKSNKVLRKPYKKQ